MPSPTTARGLLGLFPHGAYPPATDQRATTPPVQLPTSLSFRAILAAGAGGRGARGGASGRRIQKDSGGGGRQRRGEEQERKSVDGRKIRDGEEYNGCTEEDDGRTGV